MADYHKQYLSLLGDAARAEGTDMSRVFITFMAMSYNAIKKSTVMGEPAEACEAAYMAEIGRMREPDKTARYASEALGVTVEALSDSYSDFLGPIMMEASSNQRMGQFFTPSSLCDVVSALTIDDAMIKRLKEDPNFYITAQEPSVGAGAMCISMGAYLRSRDIDPSFNLVIQAIELDQRAYHACYVQLSLLGMNAEVVHGNTLSLEVYDQALTPVRRMHPKPFTQPKPTPPRRAKPKAPKNP